MAPESFSHDIGGHRPCKEEFIEVPTYAQTIIAKSIYFYGAWKSLARHTGDHHPWPWNGTGRTTTDTMPLSAREATCTGRVLFRVSPWPSWRERERPVINCMFTVKVDWYLRALNVIWLRRVSINLMDVGDYYLKMTVVWVTRVTVIWVMKVTDCFLTDEDDCYLTDYKGDCYPSDEGDWSLFDCQTVIWQPDPDD